MPRQTRQTPQHRGIHKSKRGYGRKLRPIRGLDVNNVYPVLISFSAFIPASPVVPFPADNSQQKKRENLERLFRTEVERWKKETRHLSSVTKMIAHPSYMRIMGMGPDALPLILRELRERPDHWLVALNAITGEDPATLNSTFRQAVDAWLAWGVQQGYLQ